MPGRREGPTLAGGAKGNSYPLSPDGRHLSVIRYVGTLEAKLSVIDLSDLSPLATPVPLQVVPGTVQVGRSRFTPDAGAVVYNRTWTSTTGPVPVAIEPAPDTS